MSNAFAKQIPSCTMIRVHLTIKYLICRKLRNKNKNANNLRRNKEFEKKKKEKNMKNI